jgi:MSHA biogenesis protein MshO
MRARHTQSGFTFIELVVTLVVATIVMGFTAMFIGTPIQAYLAQTRRATLSDSAAAITRNIAADVRTALPNSTRVGANGSVVALEMLNTVDVLRYRAEGDGPDAAHELKVGIADDKFSTLGLVIQPFTYIAVNNQGVAPADAYALVNVMTTVNPSNIVVNAATKETDITLTPAFNFNVAALPNGSPSHSVFFVSGPVAYLCDAGNRALHRYAGYTIDANLNTRDSDAELMAAGATRSLIATNVSACQISRSPSTAYHGDLVSLSIALTDSGETMPVFFQAQVERRP